MKGIPGRGLYATLLLLRRFGTGRLPGGTSQGLAEDVQGETLRCTGVRRRHLLGGQVHLDLRPARLSQRLQGLPVGGASLRRRRSLTSGRRKMKARGLLMLATDHGSLVEKNNNHLAWPPTEDEPNE